MESMARRGLPFHRVANIRASNLQKGVCGGVERISSYPLFFYFRRNNKKAYGQPIWRCSMQLHGNADKEGCISHVSFRLSMYMTMQS